MSIPIDAKIASKVLEEAWNCDPSTVTAVPASMATAIDAVMGASDVTFKYILVTAFVAKIVDRRIHARALQTSCDLVQSYDARSVCHKAVVPFEKTKGNLFGLSNEPFVNKPARHTEHHKDNTQLRNRAGAKSLHEALEAAQSSSSGELRAGLVRILQRGKERAANHETIHVVHHATISVVQVFCEEFLAEADGGARLVAVWGAFQQLLGGDASIEVESPNASDQFSGTAGDVEVKVNGVLVSASECKQRPLTLDDVRHGLAKARRAGVPEYLFVVSEGLEKGQEDSIYDEISVASRTLDTAVVDLRRVIETLSLAVGPHRRQAFAQLVADLCTKMRKFESANAAARIWNLLTDSTKEAVRESSSPRAESSGI
jgi:hypothetical protein